jgi:D-alanyl-D-alanine carboxypeptidase/D-alanyl-D-alanine-endopeptidase (penicillin-binding protein 4)
MNKLALLLLLGLIATSCTSSRVKKIVKLSHLDEYASGILIQEVESNKVIFQYHADHYFMPASNAKLVTFLEANRILKDSIPAYRYLETPDTLYFWGTGDPSLGHPDIKGDALFKKLASSTNKVLVLADSDKNVRPLGSGWAWDDYMDSYSAEVSLLPMYNNQVRVTMKNGSITVFPEYFTSQVNYGQSIFHQRDRNSNQFEVPLIRDGENLFVIPFLTSTKQTADLLNYEIKVPILTQPRPYDNRSKLAYAGKIDSLFVPMLQDSDNQIAEQLLYLIAAKRNWGGPTRKIIEMLTKEDSLLLPLKWVDGSGLSRYNLMRPKDLVAILLQLRKEVGEERLFKLLPESGRTGTIRRMVPDESRSRFYAKSGSFDNTYNLSGFYRNAKGKMYVFSIMGNLAKKSTVGIQMDALWILNALN